MKRATWVVKSGPYAGDTLIMIGRVRGSNAKLPPLLRPESSGLCRSKMLRRDTGLLVKLGLVERMSRRYTGRNPDYGAPIRGDV